MDIITCNPYRMLGILVNASAREKERQVRQLKQYLEAEQQPPQGDYSFPVFGKVNRTLEDVTDAASKLNLDSDKMNAALFWFWKDNEITDEAAFEALKDRDIDAARQIWEKLIFETDEDGERCWKEVTNKNCSAFHNWSIATILFARYQSWKDIVNFHEWDKILQKAICANLTFLESDFWQKLKEQVTDNTYKISKKELQLMLFNSLTAENRVSISNLIKTIKDMNFSAKQDFRKSIAITLTEKITASIDFAAKKRKKTKYKSDAYIAGIGLYELYQDYLEHLKEIFDTTDFSYSNMADRVANEILQCSITFFNDIQDKKREMYDVNYSIYIDSIDILENRNYEDAMKLAKLAQGIAVSLVIKGRIEEVLHTMQNREILRVITVLKSIEDAYRNLSWDQTIDTQKVNDTLRKTISDGIVRKIADCDDYNLLNKCVDIMSSVIHYFQYDLSSHYGFPSWGYSFLKEYYDKLNPIRISKGKEKIRQIVEEKIRYQSENHHKVVIKAITILVNSEGYAQDVKDSIFEEDIPDNILIQVAQCDNEQLINEFYNSTVKNENLRKRVEKIFVAELPFDSATRKDIERKNRERKEEEERKRKEEEERKRKEEEERKRKEQEERKRKEEEEERKRKEEEERKRKEEEERKRKEEEERKRKEEEERKRKEEEKKKKERTIRIFILIMAIFIGLGLIYVIWKIVREYQKPIYIKRKSENRRRYRR